MAEDLTVRQACSTRLRRGCRKLSVRSRALGATVAVPDTALIGAAAGLIGALIGSVSTFQAGRAQWRREARRQAYAELLTAAHNIANLLEAKTSDEDAASEPALAANDVFPFLAALDAATLLGSHRTQWVLTQWRSVATSSVGHDSSLKHTPSRRRRNSATAVEDWGTYLDRFLAEAKKELRIISVNWYQRVAVSISIFAGFGFVLAFPPIFGSAVDPNPPIPIDASFKRSGYTAFYISVGLLVLAIFYLRRAHLSRVMGVCVLIGIVFLVMVGLRPTETIGSIYFISACLFTFGMVRKWLGWQYPFEAWLWTADSVLDDA